MSAAVLVVVLVAAGLAILGGTVFSLRYFTTADRAPADPKPNPTKLAPHDAATTAQLRRFFDGKVCASCNRPIPPLQLGDLRPGLLNTDTQETIAWDDIPPADLSRTLETHVPICSHCLVAESFRRAHPELVVDRHRTVQYPMQ